MFPTLSYLEWLSGRPEEADYDLGSSALATSQSRSGVVPARLVDLPDPDDGTTLRAQLAAEYDVSPQNVLVTAGATQANFLAQSAVLAAVADDDSSDGGDTASSDATDTASSDGGDTASSDGGDPQILVERPGYQPLVSTPEVLGARVGRFDRRSDDYALVADSVRAAATEEFALAVASNRHNPSGRLASRETLAAVDAACADAGGYLLVDEVYAPLVTERATDRAFGGVTGAGLPHTVVTGSLTKFYGLGGLRIGWLIAPTEVISEARTAAAHLPTVAEPSRALARRALHNRERLSDAARDRVRANHDLLASFAADRDDLSGEVFPGSTYAFLAHDDASGDEVVEAAWEAGVLVVPGRFFDDPDAFRVALGRDPEHVGAALDALSDVLASLTADA